MCTCTFLANDESHEYMQRWLAELHYFQVKPECLTSVADGEVFRYPINPRLTLGRINTLVVSYE